MCWVPDPPSVMSLEGSACVGQTWWAEGVTDVSLVTLVSHAADVSGKYLGSNPAITQGTRCFFNEKSGSFSPSTETTARAFRTGGSA